MSSLTRIFRRLRTHGKLDFPDGTPKESPQGAIVSWLNERFQDFVSTLVSLVASEKLNVSSWIDVGRALIAVLGYEIGSQISQRRNKGK
jgi:hypothetical protein